MQGECSKIVVTKTNSRLIIVKIWVSILILTGHIMLEKLFCSLELMLAHVYNFSVMLFGKGQIK